MNNIELSSTLSNGDTLALTAHTLKVVSGTVTTNAGTVTITDGTTVTLTDESGRTATLAVTGTVTYNTNGTVTLADGTTAAFTFQDGNTLSLTGHGTTGTVTTAADGGVTVTTGDGTLDLTLTLASGETTRLNNITGTLRYSAGTVTLDAGSTLSADTTLNGEAVVMTLQTVGTGHIDFTGSALAITADTGAMTITWTKDGASSTLVVNAGSVHIGDNLFRLAVGTNVATDLKDFIPALHFTTGDAGTYTINGRTITTTAKSIAMTATDDYMAFQTSADAVRYEGMAFVGDGNVSLSSAGVALGAGVVATGFADGESFMLAEVGNVTADARIFEVTDMDTEIPIPLLVTVTGTEDGFTFSRTLTKESEAWIDDSLTADAFPNYTSPYIGKTFTESFTAKGDSSYRIRTDAIGLEEIIGISNGTTINAAATVDTETTLSVFNLVTDTVGKFTVKDKTYTIADDNEVTLRARFNEDDTAYLNRIANLNGSISGDFTGGAFRVDDSGRLTVVNDNDITIHADGSAFEILGLDSSAALRISDGGVYSVNGSTLSANVNDLIINSATDGLYVVTAQELSNIGTEQSDTITNSTPYATINALGGDDQIININAGGVYINTGEGNNAVTNLLDYSTVTGATDFEGVSIVGGSGDDSLYNIGGNHASITAGDGDDYISNRHGYYPTINAGSGSDFVRISNGHYQYIDGGAGDDTITAEASVFSGGDWAMGGYATLLGGGGNDLITPVYTNNASIDGGAGSDTILTNGHGATLTGGEGNDYIELTNEETGDYEAAVIVASAGSDTVRGYSSVATLQGDFTNATVDGSNVVLTTSDGSLTVIDGAGETLNINGVETIIGGGADDTLATYLADFMLHKTAAGYPQMALLAFNPTEVNPDAPTDYYSSETWTTTSADDLQLSAVHYSPQNPTGRWVILVHGYGKIGDAMNSFAAPYLSQGVDVLIVDQRAAGNSAGEWLTMGVAEAVDLAIWTQEIEKTNSNAQITLHGVSMGAATVMLAAALSQTTNVTGMIEDCGYENISDVLVGLLTAYGNIFGITENFETVAKAVFTAGETLTGYDVSQAAPINSIAQVTVPSLFIHGTGDGAIPVSNVEDLYNASGAESKTLLTIEGAGHAQSALVDSETYLNAVTTLLEDSTEDIGAAISSSVDNKFIRGTIYDDTIHSDGENVTIQGVGGSDTISGTNGIILAVDEGTTNTIVGFKTTDTLYFVDGVQNKAVELTDEGLTFWTDTVMGGSEYLKLTLPDITETTRLNLKYGTNPTITEVIIADGDTYYNEGKAAAETAKTALLAYNPEARVYSAEDIASLLAADVDNDFWNGDMFVELPSLPADEYIEGNDDIHTGRKVTFINNVVNVDQRFNEGGGNAAIVGNEAAGRITLTAGSGGDSLINYSSSATVSMFGGSGNDYIYNSNGTSVTVTGGGGVDTIDGETGVILAVAEGTTGTVAGFKTTDTLYFVDGEPNKAVELTSEGLSFWTDTVMGGSDYLKVTMPDITETTRVNVKYGTNPTMTEVFIADGGIYEVTNGAADIYVGAVATPDQALSFRGVSDDVDVILEGYGNSGTILNVNTAFGGDGNTTLWGSDGRSDRLVAGTGRTAIFGGWGDVGDTLVGGYSASKVDGSAFVVVGNSGSDTLSNFEYGTGGTSDILLTFGAGVSAVSVRGGDVVAAIGGDSEAVFEGGVGKAIRINDGGKDWVVNCGEGLTYSDEVNCYGSNVATTLTVDDSAGDRVGVYGDGSDGKIYHNVATVDGGGHSGRSVLVGNDFSNVLIASRGGSTLWGGVGSEADTLIGGVGTDTFIYRRGNGDDVLKSVEEGDIINLLDISLEDITVTTPSAFTTRLNFTGGGSLTIAALNDLTFRLGNGNIVKGSTLTKRE